ncbi:MAG: bifunctional DNA-formamidopyrimidine glycosylase/DNA-(apurinic or apyrimidinic site) lyase [bacterium]|nr:bifunctional DNA-formamidopyrimidine glycosylase/DNA-(apurinic or apyrimidinic site) lyase [bacterium]
MPELPEVHTIVSDLKKILPGLKIRDIWTDWPKLVKYPVGFEKFKKELVNRKILGATRKGKNILIDLFGNKTLLVHQKMTGHLLYGKWKLEKGKWTSTEKGPLKEDPQNRFLHIVFNLSNGKQLALSDVRKFAKALVWDTDKLDELKDIKDIGLDPFDKFFTLEKFTALLKAKTGKIKDALMKQEVIAGIGNIYSSEILWEADVHPLRPAQSLEKEELRDIYKAIKKILELGIKNRGDSMVDYRDVYGKKGGYQLLHKAYKREGEKCPKKDGGIIKRIKWGGRSAFFCPVHQKI